MLEDFCLNVLKWYKTIEHEDDTTISLKTILANFQHSMLQHVVFCYMSVFIANF